MECVYEIDGVKEIVFERETEEGKLSCVIFEHQRIYALS